MPDPGGQCEMVVGGETSSWVMEGETATVLCNGEQRYLMARGHFFVPPGVPDGEMGYI